MSGGEALGLASIALFHVIVVITACLETCVMTMESHSINLNAL